MNDYDNEEDQAENNRRMAQHVPMREPIKAPPLKVDKHRRELYAQLAAARAAVPSKG